MLDKHRRWHGLSHRPRSPSGQFDPKGYHFVNYRYVDIFRDLTGFIEDLRAVKAKARFVLTVSPVPLAATATQEYVIVASAYSKSTLRAVIDLQGVYYFPSFETISGRHARGVNYNPDLRTV